MEKNEKLFSDKAGHSKNIGNCTGSLKYENYWIRDLRKNTEGNEA